MKYKVINKLDRLLTDEEADFLDKLSEDITKELGRYVYSITINPANDKSKKILWGLQIALRHPKREEQENEN